MVKNVFSAAIAACVLLTGAVYSQNDTVFSPPDSAAGPQSIISDTMTSARPAMSDSAAVNQAGTSKGAVNYSDSLPLKEAADSTKIEALADSLNFQEDFRNTASKKIPFDLLLDISRGVSITRFTVREPENISTSSNADYFYDIGVLIPIKKRFFAGIAFRYVQLKFTLHHEIASSILDQKTVFTTQELMNYISLPLKFGMRFKFGRCIPYFYADFEGALLTGASQFVRKESVTVYPDSARQSSVVIQDINTTSSRKRFQPFVGAGVGLEVFYGYGTVVIEGGCQYGLVDPDAENDAKSVPVRLSSSIIYFPISAGLRFFL